MVHAVLDELAADSELAALLAVLQSPNRLARHVTYAASMSLEGGYRRRLVEYGTTRPIPCCGCGRLAMLDVCWAMRTCEKSPCRIFKILSSATLARPRYIML